MRLLAVNAGSSTLKLRLVTDDEQIEDTFDLDPWDGSADANEVSEWMRGLADVDAVGHRIVHGGAVSRAQSGSTDLSPPAPSS